MQPAQGPESPDGYRNAPRQTGHDPSIEEDLAARHLTNGRVSSSVDILIAAPTEPKVTDVTSASTSAVLVRNHQCILTRMFLQPIPCGVVEDDLEEFSHRAARRRRR
jgi:hypothetical protein